jgi:hypothetical protein
MSLTNVPGSTLLLWELVFGSMNQVHHRDGFKPGNDPSYTTRISYSHFGTPKKVVSDFTKPTSKYLRLNTLFSFYLTRALSKGLFSALCGLLYEGAKVGSNHRGVPSLICVLNSEGHRQKKGVEPPSQLHQEQSLIHCTQSLPISTSWLPARGYQCHHAE